MLVFLVFLALLFVPLLLGFALGWLGTRRRGWRSPCRLIR